MALSAACDASRCGSTARTQIWMFCVFEPCHPNDRHHLTLVCQDFAQLGQFVHVANPVFRAIKAVTPGSYTFILLATREVPRRLQHPGKKTVGVRIPRHVVPQALLAELGEPLVSSTLLLPGRTSP
jgi:tRNA A37 threonylcarbamoyladenosine synthetase subunit TsaC/SUA5/YrdC